MSLETLALFALTEFLLSLSPGPAVLLVIGLSMRFGFQTGFAATLGILSVNAVYFSLSALGIGALILASATLFTLIKWIGAAYLAYLGYGMVKPLVMRLWRERGGNKSVIDLSKAEAATAPIKHTSFRQAFLSGFTLQASNPKNIAFFVAILPQFITPGDGVALQLLILGVVSVLLELPILVLYGFASAKCAAMMKERVVQWIEGIAGGLLISMGAALAAYRRTE